MGNVIPVRVLDIDAHTHHHAMLEERVLTGKTPLIIGKPGQTTVDINSNGQYVIGSKSNPSTQSSGFMGEYDQTKSYYAGQTFLISSATVIAGIAVIAGYYGVPPAGTDVLSNPWTGFVPANPTGNAVPQSPLPTLGAAPNDKFYAKLIMAGC